MPYTNSMIQDRYNYSTGCLIYAFNHHTELQHHTFKLTTCMSTTARASTKGVFLFQLNKKGETDQEAAKRNQITNVALEATSSK